MDQAAGNISQFRDIVQYKRIPTYIALLLLSLILSACEMGRKECAYSRTVTSQQPYCSQQAPKTCNTYCDSYGCRQNCYGGGYCVQTSYRTVTSEQCQSYRCKAGYIAVGDSCLTQAEIDERKVQSEARAIKAAVDAGDNGLSLAQIAYEFETGTNNRLLNMQKAVDLYQQACTLGSGYACHEIAIYLRGGEVMAKNIPLSNEFEERACNLNERYGCHNVGWYYGTIAEPRDPFRAANAFERGCELGYPYSCVEYAIRLYNGTGIAANRSASIETIEAAYADIRSALSNAPDNADHKRAFESVRGTRENIYFAELPSPYDAFTEGRYTDAYEIMKSRLEMAKSFEQAGKINRAGLADEHGNLAWYAIAARDFATAEASAARGLNMEPTRVWINTNAAHALMLQGKSQAAAEIYLGLKGTTIPNSENRLWEVVINEDFDLMIEMGLSHPQMAEIREALR